MELEVIVLTPVLSVLCHSEARTPQNPRVFDPCAASGYGFFALRRSEHTIGNKVKPP